jgi:hypothetical protein
LCDGFVEADASRAFRDVSGISAFAWITSELGIHRLEENHSIFEFVFPFHLREDGSGEKGFESLNQNFIFHVEREHPVIPSEVNL